MSAVTKQSSIPVALRAITLLTASPAAQCEKLSILKSDSVHRQQTVLQSSLASIRRYQGDVMRLYELRASVQLTARCASVTIIAHFIFKGTPDDSAPQMRAYPEPLTPNSALLGHRLLSSDRGRVSTTLQM